MFLTSLLLKISEQKCRDKIQIKRYPVRKELNEMTIENNSISGLLDKIKVEQVTEICPKNSENTSNSCLFNVKLKNFEIVALNFIFSNFPQHLISS